MNIIEAIKSGKKFRRSQWPRFYPAGHLNIDSWYHLHEEDLLADDWEVEELKVTITRKQFFHAFSETLKETGAHSYYGSYTEIINIMAAHLGLGD